MTIEIGVVSGNLTRVAGELREMIGELSVAGLINDDEVSDYELELEGLRLRSESFLQVLDNDDNNKPESDSKPLDSINIDQDSTSAVESRVSSNSTNKAQVDLSQRPSSLPTTDSSKLNYPANSVTQSTVPNIDSVSADPALRDIDKQLIEQSAQLKEIKRLVDTLTANHENLDQTLKSQVASGHTATEIISLLSIDSNFSDKEILAFINSSVAKNLDQLQFVVNLMSVMGEKIMQPSRSLLWLFSWLAVSDQLGSDKRTVVARLRDYHQRLQVESAPKILPSPWGRGMENLFK